MKQESYLFNFEKLEIWQESRKFVFLIYSICKDFPRDEKFGLTNQLRRASVSIAANIAEGSSRFSRKDFARFLQISYGSLMEVLNHCYLAFDLNYISSKELNRIKERIYFISNKLNSLHKSLV